MMSEDSEEDSTKFATGVPRVEKKQRDTSTKKWALTTA